MARPGEPIEDLGYMAWLWCVSSKPSRPPIEVQAAQVRLLIDAYELDTFDRRNIIDMMLNCQSRNAQFWSNKAAELAHPAASLEQFESRIRWSERELSFTAAHRNDFAAALL